jgi:isopentenyl diphosphate isomerase/L-lactate dehydrogenase-like FMN-dependent dehydrogenase
VCSYHAGRTRHGHRGCCSRAARALASQRLELPPTISDFEQRAAELLPAGPHGYFAGGAGDEITLRDNVAAWQRLALRPRVMVDCADRDLTMTVLGRPLAHPLIVAPTAFHALATAEGEAASARGAAATGTLFCLSTLSTTGAAELAERAPGGRRWLQLYVLKDRGATRELVAAAVEHGYEALVLTVDVPAVWGARERDLRSGFVLDEKTPLPNLLGLRARGKHSLKELGTLFDPSLTWDDVAAFAADSGLPVLVKGVLTAADARRAVESGAAGVVVSNHGGRQLDTVLSGADALPAVVDEAGDELDVLVDGGIRRGTDVVKALALGARAVMVGRPVLWGLAVGGEAGVRRVLELLLAELDTALALAGAPRAAELDRSFLQRAPWSATG